MCEFRQQARRLGLSWSAVQAAYCQLKQSEREKRERPNAVRQAAWTMVTANTPGSWPFWRHGFCARWGRKIAQDHDYTIVPGYDEISQEVGWYFPEYADDTGTERLWDFLFSPHDKLPTREELYRKAIDLAEQWAGQAEKSPLTPCEELEF